MSPRSTHTGRFSPFSRRALLGTSAGIAAAALTGCGPGKGAAKKPAPKPQQAGGPLTFWHYYGGQATKPLEDLLAKYSAEKGVEVTPRLIPFDDFNRTLLQSATADDLPDIALVNAFDTALFAQSGMITDLSEKVQQWGQSDQYFDGPLRTTQAQGKTFAVPHVADTYALWTNDELLAGRPAPATWQDMENQAPELTRDKVFGLAYCAIEGVEGATAWLMRFLAAGGDIARLDSEAGVKAMDSFKMLMDRKATSPGVLTWNEDDVTTQFSNSMAAMMINSASYVSSIREEKPDLKWSVAPMPGDNSQHSFLSAENLTITSDSAHVDGAWDLITWMQQPAVMNEYLPARNKLPVRKDTAADPQWNDPTRKTFIDQLDVAWAPDEENAPASAEILTAVQSALQEVLSGSSAPAAALQKAQAAADKARQK